MKKVVIIDKDNFESITSNIDRAISAANQYLDDSYGKSEVLRFLNYAMSILCHEE